MGPMGPAHSTRSDPFTEYLRISRSIWVPVTLCTWKHTPHQSGFMLLTSSTLAHAKPSSSLAARYLGFQDGGGVAALWRAV